MSMPFRATLRASCLSVAVSAALLSPLSRAAHAEDDVLADAPTLDAVVVTGVAPVSPLTWVGVALAGLVSAKLRAVLEMRYLWQRPHELVNDRLVELIGAEPHTPFAIAARAAVAALDPDPQSRSATVAAVR